MSTDRMSADARRRLLSHQPNLARGAANWAEPGPEEPEPPPPDRRPLYAVIAGLVALVLVVVVWGQVTDAMAAVTDRIGNWASGIQDEVADATQVEAPPVVEEGDSVSSLLVFRDDNRQAFVLLSIAPDATASAYIAPQTLLDIVPGYGEFDLSAAYGFDGADWVAITLTNATGLRIDRVAEVDVDDLAGALGGTIPITVPTELVVDQDGDLVRLVGAGTQELDAALLIRLMTEPGDGSQFEWLRRQGAAFDAIVAEVARRPEAATEMLGSDAETAAALAAFSTSGEQTGTLPVERTAVAAGIDAFVFDRQGVAQLVEGELAHLRLRDGTRPRVEVLNGTGKIGATREIAGALARRGFRVILTDNAGSFDFEVTEIIAQGRESEQAAREVAAALGAGELFLEVRAPSGVVDVSIIVGNDIATGE